MKEGQARAPVTCGESMVYDDEYANMMARRLLNHVYARERVDFYAKSMSIGQELMGLALEPSSVVVDIGGSSGDMLYNGFVATETAGQGVCVDSGKDLPRWHRTLSEHKQERVRLVQGRGESMGLRDSCAQIVMMHNVIFRAEAPVAMLREASRVAADGGIIAVSSNERGHAHNRHDSIAYAAGLFNAITGEDIAIPVPPADGKYAEDLPELFQKAGFTIDPSDMRTLSHDSATVITQDRLADYQYILHVAANGLGIKDDASFSIWRRIIDKTIMPSVQASIDHHPDKAFHDPIKRGLFVFINRKA